MPSLTRFATRGAYRLAYEWHDADRAEGDPLGAPVIAPMVLLHDLLGDRSAFAPVRAAFATRSALVPEARGHGASAALADRRVTVADLALDTLAVMDAAGVIAAHVIGHGLGGATALAIALAHSDRVDSLTLVEPSLGAILDRDPNPEEFAARTATRAAARAAADAAYKGLTDRSLDLLLDPRWGRGWRERLARPRLAAIRRHAGALAGCLTALDGQVVSSEAVAGLTLPVSVVRGDAAAAIDCLICDRLVSLLPGARLQTVPSPVAFGTVFDHDRGRALAAIVKPFLATADHHKVGAHHSGRHADGSAIDRT